MLQPIHPSKSNSRVDSEADAHTIPAGVEDGLVVGDEDVDAVDVAAAGGDAFRELGDDANGVLRLGNNREWKWIRPARARQRNGGDRVG